MNITDAIFRFGQTQPDALAIADGTHEITYGELCGLIRRFAGYLTAEGTRPHDRVGLWLGDRWYHLVAMLAVAYLRAVAVPLDWRQKPNEIAAFVQALGLRWLLSEPGAALMLAVNGDCRILGLDAPWQAAAARAELLPPVEGSGDEPFAISATSGSTGHPKFSQMTHRQYQNAVAGMLELMGLTGRHRALCTSPLYYSGGRNSCLAHLLRGDAVLLYPNLFGAQEYIALVARLGITVTATVPSVIRQLLAAGGAAPRLAGLRALFCSGAPLYPDEKRRAVAELSPYFHERYGTAETLAVAVLRPADFAARIDSVGRPHSLIEAQIIGPQGEVLPRGDAGRLRLRGPGVATPVPGLEGAQSFEEGWFVPGEIARMDAEGFLFLEGRSTEVMIRGGAKIYPAEIEVVLAAHQAVAEAAVLGKRGADQEDIIYAFVVLREALALGALLALCRSQLPPHKVPRHMIALPALPKNTAGKVDKLALRNSIS